MMHRRRRAATEIPEEYVGGDIAGDGPPEAANGSEVASRAEALRADLAGIAARIGELTGSAPSSPADVSPPETMPAELIERLDRLASIAEPGFATINELRRSWNAIVGDMTASSMSHGVEFERALDAASARFEAVATDLDQRHDRKLAELADQTEGRLAGLSKALDQASSQLDHLIEIARPVPSALEHIREGQGRLGADSAEATLAVAALDDRLRERNDGASGEILGRLDRLAAVAGHGSDTMDSLRQSWDELVAQATTSSAERGEELGRAIEAASTRFELILAEVDQRQHRLLTEFTALGEDRLAGLSATLDVVSNRLDRLTALAQQTPAAVERLRQDQARIGAESIRTSAETLDERVLESTKQSISTLVAALDERLRESREQEIGAVVAALDERMSRFREQPISADVELLDERIRQSTEQSMAPVLARLDEFASMTSEAMETIHNLCLGLDSVVGEMTLSGAARSEGLTETLEATSGRIEAMIVDLDRRHYRHLVDFSDQGDGRLSALSAAVETLGSRLDGLIGVTEPIAGELERLRQGQGHLSAESAVGAADGLAALEEVRARLDHLTEVAETVLMMPDALERMRRQQDVLGTRFDTAMAAVEETAAEVRQLREQQQTPASEVFEHMSRLGQELEGASDRLRETSQQMAQDGQDRRGQMATLDLGLRVALTGMEAVVTGRQAEQVAQLKDAQREVVESVLEGLSRFGRQVDAGLQQATEELTTSVFLTHEDSDHRSHALQEDLTKALTRVEEAELGREEQLVDLRRVVDRLTREVQLLRPAIDLRPGPESGMLNGVTLDRFADRVAALLSQEVLARLEGTAMAPNGPTALSPVPTTLPAD